MNQSEDKQPVEFDSSAIIIPECCRAFAHLSEDPLARKKAESCTHVAKAQKKERINIAL